MKTPEAPSIPDVADERGFNVRRELWRLPIGEIFEDFGGRQRFEKIAEIVNQRGEPRHVIQCLASPFKEGQKLGPVCSAFFTTPGTILSREGGLKVFVRGERKESHAQEA